MSTTANLSNIFLSKKDRLIFLTYGRILLFFSSFVLFLFFYLLKPFFIHWPMLFKTYTVFGGLFGFYLYVLYFMKKHHQNKCLLWLGLCLDSLVLTLIMYLSNLPVSWFLFLYMLHIMLVGVFYGHQGVLYLACLSSLFFNGVWMSQHQQADVESYWVLFSMFFYHGCFFALAKASIYLGELLKQFMKSFKQTHIALHQIRGFNQWILQNIPAGLITCDASGRIVQTNDMASKILDLPKTFFMGKALQSLFPSLREKQKKLVQEKASQSFFDEDILLQKRKAISLRCHLSLALEKESQQEAFILIFEDQTPFKEMEKKVRSAEKLASIGKLAANMAHEIRNPLASISGCVEMLKESMGKKNTQNTQGTGNARNTEDGKDAEEGYLMPIITREMDRFKPSFIRFSKLCPPPRYLFR